MPSKTNAAENKTENSEEFSYFFSKNLRLILNKQAKTVQFAEKPRKSNRQSYLHIIKKLSQNLCPFFLQESLNRFEESLKSSNILWQTPAKTAKKLLSDDTQLFMFKHNKKWNQNKLQ